MEHVVTWGRVGRVAVPGLGAFAAVHLWAVVVLARHPAASSDLHALVAGGLITVALLWLVAATKLGVWMRGPPAAARPVTTTVAVALSRCDLAGLTAGALAWLATDVGACCLLRGMALSTTEHVLLTLGLMLATGPACLALVALGVLAQLAWQERRGAP